MNIKLLIVDDETIIRKGLRHYIDWNQHGIEVVAEASDGVQGISCALKYQPDIIVSDIRMPNMDGIEMAKEIKKLMPKVKIILLSGYSDKEYLISAIKLNAFDFVMKSANSQDVFDAVMKAKDAIFQEQKEHTAQVESAKILEDNYSLLRQELMVNLLSGNTQTINSLGVNDYLDVKFPGPVYVLVYIDALIKYQNEIAQNANFFLKEHAPFFELNRQNQMWGILSLNQGDDINSILSKFLSENVNHTGAKILYSSKMTCLEQITLAYKNMLVRSQSLCWIDECVVKSVDEIKSTSDFTLDILLRLEDECLNSFSQNNILVFHQRITEFYRVSQINQLPMPLLKDSLKRIVANMYRQIDCYEESAKILEKIEFANTVKDVFAIVYDSAKIKKEDTNLSTVVKNAINFINENYTSQVTLTQIANFCYVSPAHLSKIFKEEMGTGVVEYIRNLRIEKAKALLQNSNSKIQDIAQQVGYSEHKHFSTCFVQVVGMSPREYRQGGNN